MPPLTPTLTRLRSEGRRSGDARVFPAQYDLSGLSLPNAFHAVYRAPAEADYVIRVGLGGLRPAGSAPIAVTIWADGREVASLPFDAETSARFDDDQQDFGGQALQFRIRLSEGDHDLAVAIPRIYEGLPARYGGPNPSSRDVRRRPFNPPASASAERIAQMRKVYDERQAELQKIPLNGVRVSTVDVGGPYAQVTGPSRESSNLVYVCGHRSGGHTASCATRIMTSLAGARSAARSLPPRSRSTWPSCAGHSRTRGRSRKAWRWGFRRCSCRRTFSSASNAIVPQWRAGPRARSRSTSWRRACRISLGKHA